MEKTLYNQISIPVIGYGVYQITDQELCEECVVQAIQSGYRLIDTAAAYENEEADLSHDRESHRPEAQRPHVRQNHRRDASVPSTR